MLLSDSDRRLESGVEVRNGSGEAIGSYGTGSGLNRLRGGRREEERGKRPPFDRSPLPLPDWDWDWDWDCGWRCECEVDCCCWCALIGEAAADMAPAVLTSAREMPGPIAPVGSGRRGESGGIEPPDTVAMALVTTQGDLRLGGPRCGRSASGTTKHH